MTIGERRAELNTYRLTELRRMLRQVKKQTNAAGWVDARKRADLVQAIISFEVQTGTRMEAR